MNSGLTVILPVRNGEQFLPGYFKSIDNIADSVIALDDGSTDATREILESQIIIRSIISNPKRDNYLGWSSKSNANKLIKEASKFDPKWILLLDADERIDPEDGSVLIEFLKSGAKVDTAYGLEFFRMVNDENTYDKRGLWVHRLFYYHPGDRIINANRFHAQPIPYRIKKWVKTSIRVKHLAGLTAGMRQSRFNKYREVDPDNTFQSSYRSILDRPSDLKTWTRRESGCPVLVF